MLEWWTPQQAGMLGGILGSVAGLYGALIGTLAGVLGPKGKARTLVMSLIYGTLIAGIGATILGFVALAIGQPQHVTYPTLLVGVIVTIITITLIPVIHRVYERVRLAQTAHQGPFPPR